MGRSGPGACLGGAVEAGESFKDAAMRGLREETGIGTPARALGPLRRRDPSNAHRRTHHRRLPVHRLHHLRHRRTAPANRPCSLRAS
ncbi:NUDIX domain-containing protein [Nonomuraea sp. CA-218870]|uniref:NUDIX domain-containing protein n=1 Tax=Nonomuraea sp. CA-218870 TaxID=3239998 RepID=UPI003D9436B9